MPSHVRVVLEHLAATGWFAQHGEVALTAGLTFCLEKDPAAAQEFIKLVRTHTGHTPKQLPVPVRWQAEYGDANRMRVDVAGLRGVDEEAAPVVFVEAKVSAVFAQRQVSEYVEFQKRRLRGAGIATGALVVLVPEARVRSADEEVSVNLSDLGATRQGRAWRVDGEPEVAVTVISWDAAIRTMRAHDGPAACDLAQLLGACRGLQGADVAALTKADLEGEWRQRKDDVRLIIDRVTREAIGELSLSTLPWQQDAFGGFEGGFRYLGVPDFPNLAVGMRRGEPSSPFWVRWHRQTVDVESVAARLTTDGHHVQKHDGHVWLSLELEPDTGSATRQIASLVAQVVRLYKIAVNWVEPS